MSERQTYRILNPDGPDVILETTDPQAQLLLDRGAEVGVVLRDDALTLQERAQSNLMRQTGVANPDGLGFFVEQTKDQIEATDALIQAAERGFYGADSGAVLASALGTRDDLLRGSAAEAAATAARQLASQRDALVQERDEVLRSLRLADAEQKHQDRLARLGQDTQEAQAGIDSARELAQLRLQSIENKSRDTAAALRATLETMGIRDAGTFRDYSLETQASRTQLNRLTGIGSPIADFTQGVREEERKEQVRLQEIDQEEARRQEAARQQQFELDRRAQQVQLTDLRQQESNLWSQFLTVRNQQQGDYERSTLYEQTGWDYDTALQNLANGVNSTSNQLLSWEQGGSSVGQWNVAQPYVNTPKSSPTIYEPWGGPQ